MQRTVRPRSLRNIAVVLIAILFIMVLMAGCASADKTSGSKSNTQESTAAAGAANQSSAQKSADSSSGTAEGSKSTEGTEANIQLSGDLTKSEVLKINAKYSAEDNNGTKGQPNNVFSAVRKKPVLLSAPYAVKQGENSQATHTGSLVEISSTRADCSFIAKAYNDGEDPHADAKSVYRDTILELIKKNRIKYVVDIAQIKKGDNPKKKNIVIFTDNLKFINNSSKIQNAVKAAAEKSGISYDWSAESVDTTNVASVVYKQAGIPALHIRIASEYRTTNEIDKYNQMVMFLTELANQLAGI